MIQLTKPGTTTALAYCSSANLGAGFDVFGLALDHYSDTVRVSWRNSRGVRIRVEGNYGQLPESPSKNSAGPPALELLHRAGEKTRGLEITVQKGVPPGLGLGSSGATAAACTRAVDAFLGLRLPDDELVSIASLGEKAVSGNAHADNVAASLLGGFSIVYGNEPMRTLSIKPPSNLSAVVATPFVALPSKKTRAARKLLPQKIPIPMSVSNTGHASAMVAGFLKGDIGLIGNGMHDEIAEPYRQKMIPAYKQVREAALRAGASGVAISGAGPSVIAIVNRNKHTPEKIGRAMSRAFARGHIKSSFFTARPAPPARVIRGS